MVEEETIGARIRCLRELASISQRELAELSGWSHGGIALLELGRRRPLADGLRSISEVLGCSLDWLCSGKGKQPDSAAVQLAICLARRRRAGYLT